MKNAAPFCKLLLVFILFNSMLCHAQGLQEWIILKDATTGYKDQNFTQNRSRPVFKFRKKVYGVLQKDSTKPFRSWGVEVKEGNQTIYFPYAELVLNKPQEIAENLEIGKEIVDIHTPLPFDYKPDDLVKIDQKWNYHGKYYPKYIRKEVHGALIAMLKKAESEGIHLFIVSAFRDFEKQRSLYLRALRVAGIEQVGTAKPAHSEHQLGTTVDLTSKNRADLLSLSFDKTPEGKWLKENAPKFGFMQTYTKEDPKGYMPEPWHYRYVQPNITNHDN